MFVVDLQFDHRHLADICSEFGVERLEVFGSFASGEADRNSDIDLLVTFHQGVKIGLGFVRLRRQLSDLMGREVDLHERASVEDSPNKYFRKFALEQTEHLYAA
jgi:predicted nucleotidyltransferase